MPRHPKPWWNPQKNRWAVNIGKKRKFAPADIGHHEKPQRLGIPIRAWDWYESLRASGEVESVQASGLTVRRLCQLYLKWAKEQVAAGKLKKGTYNGHRTKLGRLASIEQGGRSLGDRLASELGAADLDLAVRHWENDYTAWYVRGLVRSIQGAYSWAARPIGDRTPERLLDANPIAGYRPPGVPRSPERFAERSEAARFLWFWWRDYAGRQEPGSVGWKFERNAVLLERVLIGTGCRPGEACTLQWDDIQWDAGQTTKGHKFAKGVIPPERWKAGGKTGKPRVIYFTPTLTRALRRLHAREERHPTHVFVHAVGIRTGRHKGRLADFGDPWNAEALAAKVKKVRRAAIEEGKRLKAENKPTRGLDKLQDEGPNKVTNYRWRHTAISNLLMMGVDVATAAELTGTSPEMIRKSYGHLLDGHLALAAEKLGAVRRPGRQP